MLTPLPTTNKQMTLSYKYQKSQEFVFSCRGQPFVTLVSPDHPPPSSTLLDFKLARELNLKLTNVQCQKYTYAGFKMRIVGSVSTPVQFVRDGFPVGKFLFTATVVRGLSDNLETDSIAAIRKGQVSQLYFMKL